MASGCRTGQHSLAPRPWLSLCCCTASPPVLPGSSGCLLSSALSRFSSLRPSSHTAALPGLREGEPAQFTSTFRNPAAEAASERTHQGRAKAKGATLERGRARRTQRRRRGEDRRPPGSWSRPTKGHHTPRHCTSPIPHQRRSSNQKALIKTAPKGWKHSRKRKKGVGKYQALQNRRSQNPCWGPGT